MTQSSKTSMGETTIAMPRDRQAFFESVILPKHKHDVSDIENKVLAMYARGMSQRDISATIDDIYGFKTRLCHKFCVIAERNRDTTPSSNSKTQKI